jgi:hypothetical protein
MKVLVDMNLSSRWAERIQAAGIESIQIGSGNSIKYRGHSYIKPTFRNFAWPREVFSDLS